MNILLIVGRYLPHRGGLESVVYHLAQEFCYQGHSVMIITNRYPRSLPASEEIDGVQVRRLHFLLPDRKYLQNGRLDLWLAGLWYRFYTVKVLRSMINTFQPDMINNHYLNEVTGFTGCSLNGLTTVIPWIISLHGGDVDGEPSLGRTNKERFGKLSQQANGLTACSFFLAAQAEVLEPALHGKIEVIHNGVDAQLFAEANPYPADHPYILAVGQLSSHKGFDLLIKAFAEVAGGYPQVQLWIAGDGQENSALELLINQNELSQRVRLLGRVNEATVAALMAGCLFIAMPSRREPFGLVALEGMAAGKPVMAAPVGGLPEFLNVPPNCLIPLTIAEWVMALNKWLALAASGRLKASENKKEAFERDWSNVANQYLRVYQKALNNG